jgi:hypothetical protein
LWLGNVDLAGWPYRRASEDVEEEARRRRLPLGAEPGEHVGLFVLLPVNPLDDVPGETGTGLVYRPFLDDHVGAGP